MFTINPRVRPHIHITGVATECSKTDATFEVIVEQYITCVKSDEGDRLKSTTPFFCRIPDSPKYRRSSKPIPGNKRYVSLSGFLAGVDRTGENRDVQQFVIEVENITFCGYYVQPANAASSPSCKCIGFL